MRSSHFLLSPFLILAMSSVVLITVTAHYTLDYPVSRGIDEETQSQYPCGGLDRASSQRTLYPLVGGAISLTTGHAMANTQIMLALGNVGSPDYVFNYSLRSTFTQIGIGKFCMTNIDMPPSLDISEGTNATIQVITNGHLSGGLYQCADITFGISAFDFEVCQNTTGVSISSTKVKGNANESVVPDQQAKDNNAAHIDWSNMSHTLFITTSLGAVLASFL